MHQKLINILFVFGTLFGFDVTAQHRPTIDRTLLEVKTTKLQFSCGGGTRKIGVKSGNDWRVTVSDSSWCHVIKSSGSIDISVDENTLKTLRKAIIKVSNGKSEKELVVLQETSVGTINSKASSSQQNKNETFSVMPQTNRFDANGGMRTITVTGSSNWCIDANPASWTHLDKSGNGLTLTADSNSSISSRSAFFVLKSGEEKIRVDIIQDGHILDNNLYASSEEVYLVTEEDAEYPGGLEALSRYLSENVKYPQKARENNITGRVFVTFVVEKDGSVSHVKLLRDIGAGCGEEAVRVVKAMLKWKPGRIHGEVVRTQFNLPINFELEQEERE